MIDDPLGTRVRTELAAITPTTRCDRLAELSALFHTAGKAILRGRGRVDFELDLGESSTARRAFTLLSSVRVRSEISTYQQRAFGRATRYRLQIDGDAHTNGVLAEAGVLSADGVPVERPPGRIVARPCCRAAYLRGAFLGGGSVSGPRSPHLELRTPGHAGAAFIRSVASAAGVRLRVIDRTDHAAAYAKGWDAIEGLLSVAGAADTVVALEERALVAGLRADANRLANADHANLVRQSIAAQRQLAAARSLRDADGLDALTPRLAEAAQLRLRFPIASVRELADRTTEPTSKAAMARRLARLVELVEDDNAGS